MRHIEIPRAVVEAIVNGAIYGTHVTCAVAVEWPELRLTEEQIIANAIALANGLPDPYPDQSIFAIDVPRVIRKTLDTLPADASR